jgi:formate dehydrogenase iron-sulfur subunit
MIAEAEKRLKAKPTRYHQAIYGKEEAGGTSILYLTHQPLDELGFKPVTKRSLPSYTWQALRLVPGIFLTVGGGLSLLSWFTHRKERLKREQDQLNGASAPENKEVGK